MSLRPYPSRSIGEEDGLYSSIQSGLPSVSSSREKEFEVTTSLMHKEASALLPAVIAEQPKERERTAQSNMIKADFFMAVFFMIVL